MFCIIHHHGLKTSCAAILKKTEYRHTGVIQLVGQSEHNTANMFLTLMLRSSREARHILAGHNLLRSGEQCCCSYPKHQLQHLPPAKLLHTWPTGTQLKVYLRRHPTDKGYTQSFTWGLAQQLDTTTSFTYLAITTGKMKSCPAFRIFFIFACSVS